MAKEYDGEPRWDGIDPDVRAACEKWWAELDALNADPKVQAAIAEAVAAAQAAEPPFMQDGVELVPPIPDQFRLGVPLTPEQRAELKQWRNGLQRIARTVNIDDLLGKKSKTQEQKDMAKLRDARNKVRKLGDTVRTNMFNDWLDRCVVKAEEPREWARASDLYASYVRHARQYGPTAHPDKKGTVTDRMVAREEMSTETGWGRMMAGVSTKTRRASGNYYPLRLKRGA